MTSIAIVPFDPTKLASAEGGALNPADGPFYIVTQVQVNTLSSRMTELSQENKSLRRWIAIGTVAVAALAVGGFLYLNSKQTQLEQQNALTQREVHQLTQGMSEQADDIDALGGALTSFAEASCGLLCKAVGWLKS